VAVRVRVAAFVTDGDRVLLVEHAKAGRRYWLLPGGGVEAGETLAQATTREIREETGFDIEPGRLLLVCEAIQPGGRHLINLVFAAALRGGELRCGADRVLRDARWVTRSEFHSLPVRPPILDELEQCWDDGFAGPVRVLGNVWQPED